MGAQIDAFHKNYPKRRLGIGIYLLILLFFSSSSFFLLYFSKFLGIVTFNDEVQVIGDGTQAPITVAGDKLDNYSTLVSDTFNSAFFCLAISARFPLAILTR